MPLSRTAWEYTLRSKNEFKVEYLRKALARENASNELFDDIRRVAPSILTTHLEFSLSWRKQSKSSLLRVEQQYFLDYHPLFSHQDSLHYLRLYLEILWADRRRRLSDFQSKHCHQRRRVTMESGVKHRKSSFDTHLARMPGAKTLQRVLGLEGESQKFVELESSLQRISADSLDMTRCMSQQCQVSLDRFESTICDSYPETFNTKETFDAMLDYVAQYLDRRVTPNRSRPTSSATTIDICETEVLGGEDEIMETLGPDEPFLGTQEFPIEIIDENPE